MQRAILLTVLLFSSIARAAPATLQQVHEIRTHGFMLCANLLVYYNNQDPAAAFDPAAREAYRRNLRELDPLVTALADKPALATALQGLKTSIGELEQQPENARVLYTSSLNPVMHTQNDLDEAAGAAYREAEEKDPVIASLHQMSLDMSRLLLIHQGKGFDNLGIRSVELDEHSINTIDRRIGSTYENLLKLSPEIKAELNEVWRNYSFVRQRLKADDKGGVSRSASLYLGKGVEMLDMLARNASQ
ncbi:conserved exported hypothetical protein [Pseudomonas sp. OF001]|uniref:hypothetical protein n=1 Tax=Pseudomonas sp. OF001 TaxID=2772300 RepID=UPI00191A8328|nr:hypothetical protein [Pseudomonas sp. OF001]CAD5378369.1 conserved exported hypothetical protein [Pseudomonas sp. OF001]